MVYYIQLYTYHIYINFEHYSTYIYIYIYIYSGGRLCTLIGVPCRLSMLSTFSTFAMYCFNTNHRVLRVLKLTPRQGTPMRVHKRPPELCGSAVVRECRCRILTSIDKLRTCNNLYLYMSQGNSFEVKLLITYEGTQTPA